MLQQMYCVCTPEIESELESQSESKKKKEREKESKSEKYAVAEEKRGVNKSVLKCTSVLRYDKANKSQNTN